MNITEESELIESFFQEAAKRKMANYGQEEILDFRILQSKYTTDQIFELLPSFVYHNGYYYHFNLIKGKRGVSVYYEQNSEDGGQKLGKTYKHDYKLKTALIKTYIFLKEHKYI